MVIQSKRVWYNEKWVPLQIVIKEDKIVQLNPYGLDKVDYDYGNNRIIPGMIDIHTHGYNGKDFLSTCTKEWLLEWLAYLPKEGVTSLVPGTSSQKKEVILNSMRIAGEVIEENNHSGANLLGVYSEGPFMSVDYKGAQPVEYLVIPEKKDIDEYIEACKGHLIYCMVAPEMLKGDYSIIKYLRSKNIEVACGHTGATFNEISEAREAGAKSFTHTYNGMRGLHHREPGTVGAAMYYDDMYCELIGDMVHVNPISANILARLKGKDKLITVTDAVSLKGIKEKILPFGDNDHLTVCDDGVCRLDNGTICGSVGCLNKNLQKEIEVAHIDEVTAINSVTINPMRLLHFADHKGLIEVNYDSDIVVMDDNYDIIQTYVLGKKQI